MDKIRFSDITLGTDCEVFLRDLTGHPITAIGIIPGTKEEPFPILTGNGFAMQRDNVMLEWNIPPVTNLFDWENNIGSVLDFLSGELKQKNIWIDYSPVCFFPEKALEHPEALSIGCSPDFCVWSGKENAMEWAPILDTMRSAGGHIHTGYRVNGRKPTMAHRQMVVKGKDLRLGVPSILMDNCTQRRLIYGKAGAYRPKIYGDEYRVLSNFWAKFKTLREWVFTETYQVFIDIEDGLRIDDIPGLGERIQKTINNSDKAEAEKLVKEFDLNLSS